MSAATDGVTVQDLPEPSRLSVPTSARRFSALCVSGTHSSSGAHSLGLPGGGARRLSALVPEAVARRLSTVSTSLGLARPSPPDCLIEQGKALCALYMRSRMRSGPGAPSRAVTSTHLVSPWAGARLVFPRLSQLGRHLERARPRLYAAVGKHAAPPAVSSPSSPAPPDPADIVYGIGVELFKSDITWGKVVSLMAVCGALASEPRGSTDLAGLIDAAAAAMRGPLQLWLAERGGWYGLLEHCQPLSHYAASKQGDQSVMRAAGGLIVTVILILLMWLILKDLLN